MIIDTHCHLTFPDFDRDRDAMLQRAADAGVTGFVTVATEPREWQRCLDLAEGRRAIRVALGVHPNEAACWSPETGAALKALAEKDSRVVAIGETGLDFFRDNAPRERQYEAFRAQLEISAELGRPFILHCRAAEEEMLEALAEFHARAPGGGRPCPPGMAAPAPLRGVWHCFTATPAHAERATAMGLYFGLGGIATYPKAAEVRQAAALMPPDRILLETDCPFLPPQGWRGQRNEPAYLAKVVETLAEVRRTTREEIWRLTTENARRLFGEW